LTLLCKRITIWLVAVLLNEFALAQAKMIMGKVLDSATHAPLQNVSVTIKNSTKGGLTDADGKFSITVGKNLQKITLSNTGYHSSTIILTDSAVQELTILLSKSYTTLEDVIFNAKKERYRNKNNPAVELIRQVIANKSKNGPGAYPFSSYQEYEKVRMFTDGPWSRITHNFILKKFRFFFENTDTSIVAGKSLNSIYLQEVLSDNYYRRDPEKKRKLILGKKTVDYGEFVDTKGIQGALNYLYDDVNIYDNSILAFTMQFMSPIASLAPDFYMYFIRDSIVENGEKLVKLYFTPRNPEDLLFHGTLYITLDGNYAVRRVELSINKHVNLNYVRNFEVNQDFEKGPEGRYHLAESDMIAFLSPLPKSPGLFGERKISIQHFSDSVLPDRVFQGPALDSLPISAHQPAAFWTEGRPIPLSLSENQTYANTDSLIKLRSYKRLMDLATLYFIGYKSAGKFDIGPIRKVYSFNPVEGQKFELGGRSNYKLSSRFYTDAYLAYGLKDERWKYFLSGSYSFNNRSIYSYPFNYLEASFLKDTKNPGQEDLFSQGNSFLSSFTRGYNSNWLYNDIFRITYIREFGNHFQYTLGTKYWKQEPAGSFAYIYQQNPLKQDTLPEITTGEISISLRWAPNEQFFQNKVSRRDITNKYPILNLEYAKGIKGLYGAEYAYDAFRLNIYKRFFISPLGYSDVSFNAGYLSGTLPFPLLIIHPANQSYFYSQHSYNLMNVEEFVSDHYAGVNIDHFFNGFFFNKIPLLKKLRLRELITAKILYGGLRNENNPSYNSSQLLFPVTNGATSTFVLDHQPYVEAGVGIYNIFSFIRLDLIKRFTYLNNPNISTLRLLVSTNFNF
jgi:Family of unknown function (DUF5686)/CarboxypepD_reg-like domain